MRFEDRFTERAKLALNLAHDAASEMGHGYVGSEHILLGLIREKEGVAARTLRRAGLDEEMIVTLIEKYVGRGERSDTTAQGLTPRGKRIVELAAADAARLGHSYVGTEHLLMGILRETESVAARILVSTGADLNSMYTELLNMFRSAEYRPVAAVSHERQKKSETKILDQFSRDLTGAAQKGELDPVIGRDKEIQRVVQILSRRTKNNPVLIGEPGVGKTAIAEGLAQKIESGDVPETLRDKRVVSLDLTGMVAGTKYRGDFEERIKNAIDEVKKAKDVVLFIDEVHTLIGAGSAEGAIDAANIIKPALGRGEIQIIGATTLDEYRRYIEKDAALERRFQPVTVNEPTEEESILILKGLRDKYEAHHRLKISDEAIEAAVTMSARYINDRFLPDKAVDLIDEASSRVRMETMKLPPELKRLEDELHALTAEKESAVQHQEFERAARLRDTEQTKRKELDQYKKDWEAQQISGIKRVTPEDIASVVSEWTGVPITSITEDESQRLLKMEETLHERMVGQNEAVSAVARAIRRGRVGLKDPKRPIGSFLFLGPTGVGKTELCKALAQAMFGDENAMIRVDMSEYMEKHTVSKLIGTPPGYVGYDEGGQLTEKIRRKPYSVVLFDEIEKAHEDVFNILLQIMEDGILTDSHGRRVDFKNAIIVMTSNVGAKKITDKQTRLGFAPEDKSETDTAQTESIRAAVMGELRRTFKPEFLNRIDDIIVFHQLTKADIQEIARKMLDTVSARVAAMGYAVKIDDSAMNILAEKGFDPKYGARPLRRAIQSMIEDGIAEKILDGTVTEGDALEITGQDGRIIINKAEAANADAE